MGSYLASWYFEPSQLQWITSGLKQTSVCPLYTLHPSHQTTNSLKTTESVLTQIYIKQDIHKHQTQNFWRISPFGIAPLKKTQKARTRRFHGPFHHGKTTKLGERCLQTCSEILCCGKINLKPGVPFFSTHARMYASLYFMILVDTDPRFSTVVHVVIVEHHKVYWWVNMFSWDILLVTTLDSWSTGCKFESWQECRENFLLQS